MSISPWPQRILGKILGIFCSGRNLIFTPLWIIIGQLRIGAIGAVVVCLVLCCCLLPTMVPGPGSSTHKTPLLSHCCKQSESSTPEKQHFLFHRKLGSRETFIMSSSSVDCRTYEVGAQAKTF